jgi:hypothetical protein
MAELVNIRDSLLSNQSAPPLGDQFDRCKNFAKKGLSMLVRPTVGSLFKKRRRDRKDFAQGATEAAGGSPPNRPD